MIFKPIGMIIHVISVKEESSIFGTFHKIIPYLFILRAISFYFDASFHFKYSSKFRI